MNHVSLIGRLTQDLVLRESNNQNKFLYFTIAVNEYQGGNEFTNFIPCIAWNIVAENMSKFLKKGSLVGVTGRISVRSKNENGKYETIVNVNADRVEFLESKTIAASHNNSNFEVNNERVILEEPILEKSSEQEKETSTDLDDSILWD